MDWPPIFCRLTPSRGCGFARQRRVRRCSVNIDNQIEPLFEQTREQEVSPHALPGNDDPYASQGRIKEQEW